MFYKIPIAGEIYALYENHRGYRELRCNEIFVVVLTTFIKLMNSFMKNN